LIIMHTPLVSDISVSINIPVKTSGCCLNKLKSGSSSCCAEPTLNDRGECVAHACFPSHSEEKCACYAQFLVIQNALCGDPSATVKSKVSSVQCGIGSGNFSITWRTKGTASSMRKSLGIALKNLSPAKHYAVYASCIKSIGQSANREHFNYVVCKINESIKVAQCRVVGNIKIKKEKEKAILGAVLDVLSKKINIADCTKGVKPDTHTECTLGTCLKVSDWKQFVVQDYINAKAKGIHVLCDADCLYVQSAQWKTISKKLAGYVSDYVKAKYSINDLQPVLAYMCSVAGMSVDSVLKGKISVSDIEKAIVAQL
jgi:hypothetical protein